MTDTLDDFKNLFGLNEKVNKKTKSKKLETESESSSTEDQNKISSRKKSKLKIVKEVKENYQRKTKEEYQYISKVNKCLDAMHNGSNLYKCTTYGFPHFRMFLLSPDNKKIYWTSNKKDINKTTIYITDIQAIIIGQNNNLYN